MLAMVIETRNNPHAMTLRGKRMILSMKKEPKNNKGVDKAEAYLRPDISARLPRINCHRIFQG